MRQNLEIQQTSNNTTEHMEHCLLAVAEGLVSIEWSKVAPLAGVKVDAIELTDRQSELLADQGRWGLAYPTQDELNR